MVILTLAQFKRETRNRQVVYGADIENSLGKVNHRLEILGPEKLIKSTFVDAPLNVEITPGIKEEQWETGLRDRFAKLTAPPDEKPQLPTLEDFLKVPPKTPTADRTIVLQLRSLSRTGTAFGFTFGPYLLQQGHSWIVSLTNLCKCWGLLMPVWGDPDLYLTLNGATWSAVTQSVLGGTSWDYVSYQRPPCWPWNAFQPTYRVYGFRQSFVQVHVGGWSIP